MTSVLIRRETLGDRGKDDVREDGHVLTQAEIGVRKLL